MRRPRVLVLSRNYPSGAIPNLGLWVERPVRRITEGCDVRGVAPVPWRPPALRIPRAAARAGNGRRRRP